MSQHSEQMEFMVWEYLGLGTLNPKPENRTEPKLSVYSGFGFGPDNIIIRGSVSIPIVYNPKFNIVAYFDLDYECYKLQTYVLNYLKKS
jgi:hypothetical protein